MTESLMDMFHSDLMFAESSFISLHTFLSITSLTLRERDLS